MSKYIDVNIFPDMEDEFLFCTGGDYISLKRLRSFIKAIPTADVAEVVRCKDCVFHYRGFILNGRAVCSVLDIGTNDDFYCRCGEKIAEVEE